MDALRRKRFESASFPFRDRDVALYNLSIGARSLRRTYEGDPDFAALPTFAVMAALGATDAIPLGSILPRYNHDLLLHGEHYLRLEGPLPRRGTLVNTARVIDVRDKGKAAVVVIGVESCSGSRTVCYNELTCFIRGSGGFGNGGHSPAQRDAMAIAANDAPRRPPDANLTEATDTWQAAVYRLNGDLNPLHIDPRMAAAAGFPRPILHGLCTLGVSVRSILAAFAADSSNDAVLSIKARFSGHVFPGETLQISAWQTDERTVVFLTRVLERKALAITQAAVTFRKPLPDRPKRPHQARL